MHSRTPGSNYSESFQRRTPARAQENGASGSTSPIRPLQISRPPSRPQTPASHSRGDSTLSTSPKQPTRPQRSVHRDRQASAYTTSDRASMDSSRTRESADPYADAFDPSPTYPQSRSRSRNNSSAYLHPMPTNGTSRAGTSLASPVSPMSDTSEPLSATSLAAVAMFQGLAKRRGTIDDDAADQEYRNQRRQEMEDQQARQRKLKSKTPGYRVNGKAKAGDIDAILDEIKDEWAALINPDFNPVELALQLLDESSSLGKDMDSFHRTKVSLSQALKGSVDKHYEAFAAALPHHSALLNHLGVAQTQIVEAKSALQEAKETLGKKRPDLVQLWSRSQTIEDMMRILDQIERLRQVPDILESLISEKRLLQAAILLVRGLKMINKQDMLEIGAVSDLRSYLVSQETSLREILIDELHSHLYLKSFWCESRWAVYTPGQQSLLKVEYEDEPTSDSKQSQPAPWSSASTSSRPTRLRRFLDDLAVRPNDPPYDVDEQGFRNSTSGMSLTASASASILGGPNGTAAGSSTVPSLAFTTLNQPQSSNPEADSFMYMETLLEALAVLGKLSNSLDVVAQKLPAEIFSLVDNTIVEVEERAEYGRRGSVLTTAPALSRVDSLLNSGLSSGVMGVSVVPSGIGGHSPGAVGLRLAALELSTKWADQETLRDLFWTLYSKLEAVAQGLRVVYEVANRIGLRRDFKDTVGDKPGNLFPIADVWMPVQAEVRTLINDYVTDEEQGAISGRNPISSINEVLRDGKSSRDRSKHVFRFADTDPKNTTNALRVHEDELTRVLRDTVPGLVQGLSENAVQATLSAVGTDDRLLGTGQHHRLLVRPDAFHVTVLFQPTLLYLERLSDVLPPGLEAARSSHELLDEFVLKVYLPQLEDKVSLLFHQTVSNPDAFEPDHASTKLSPQPLIQASVQLLALINSLCVMLQTTPFHRESYSRLVLTVIGQFYQRCSDRFSDLVAVQPEGSSENSSRVALAAQWAQRAELSACLTELYKLIISENSSVKSKQLCRQETHLELNALGSQSIASSDLVSSVRNLSALASLYRSMTWFTEELSVMKNGTEPTLSPSSPTNLKLDPIGPSSASQPTDTLLHRVDRPSLPLSTAMALRFQALSMTYAQLAELILFSIRIDIRCRIMHQMDLALRRGVYHIDREVTEPDPYVIDLNVELSKCDDIVSATLPEKERRFAFEGIGQLLEHLLIANARYIRAANGAGIRKMMRNILALQQNIRTLAEDSREAEFERARRYYSLFALSPQDMIDGIRHKQEFTFDEYKTMLDLMCGVDPSQSNNSAPQATDRNYSMYVIDLHGLVLEENGEAGS